MQLAWRGRIFIDYNVTNVGFNITSSQKELNLSNGINVLVTIPTSLKCFKYWYIQYHLMASWSPYMNTLKLHTFICHWHTFYVVKPYASTFIAKHFNWMCSMCMLRGKQPQGLLEFNYVRLSRFTFICNSHKAASCSVNK